MKKNEFKDGFMRLKHAREGIISDSDAEELLVMIVLQKLECKQPELAGYHLDYFLNEIAPTILEKCDDNMVVAGAYICQIFTQRIVALETHDWSMRINWIEKEKEKQE